MRRSIRHESRMRARRQKSRSRCGVRRRPELSSRRSMLRGPHRRRGAGGIPRPLRDRPARGGQVPHEQRGRRRLVEVGETFEDAVRREVFEETGIRIKNIRYFGSQPWAFPNSQMVGFLADYDSGEIQLQETELHDAQWFSSTAPLPELPPTGTIALKLINATLELCKAEQNK